MMMSLALFPEEYSQSSNSRIGDLGNHVLQSEIKKKKEEKKKRKEKKKKRRYIYIYINHEVKGQVFGAV